MMTVSMTSNIRTEIAHLAVNITELHPHPRNVRQGDIGAISTSLAAHGQYKPILVQSSTNFIIAGNHTWKAASQLGWSEIAALKLDIDDDKALRILLADNRATDLATYDDHALAEILSEYARSYDMSGLIWDQDDLDELLRREQFRLTEQAFPTLSRMPTEGGVNPLDQESDPDAPTDNTRSAVFFLTPEEFEELRIILDAANAENRNDALLKVAREWRSHQENQE